MTLISSYYVNYESIIFKNLSNHPQNLCILPMMVENAHIINEIVNIYALCTVKIHIEKSKLNRYMIEIAQMIRPFMEKGQKRPPTLSEI